MRESVRSRVLARAANRCEYCRLRQEDSPFATFHVEHIRAKQHGGGDEDDNLALACHRCNAHKGPNLTGIDPDTGALVALFNPRVDEWRAHFQHAGAAIMGLTPTGRATVLVLNMNEPQRISLRQRLIDLQEFD